MKLLMVIIGVIMLTGCEPSYKDYTESFTNLPEGLKDCKIYGIQNGNSMSLSVVRCPNSTVSIELSFRDILTNVGKESPSFREGSVKLTQVQFLKMDT